MSKRVLNTLSGGYGDRASFPAGSSPGRQVAEEEAAYRRKLAVERARAEAEVGALLAAMLAEEGDEDEEEDEEDAEALVDRATSALVCY